MEIELYSEERHRAFSEMFLDYFLGDFKAPFSEEMIRDEIIPKYTELSKQNIAPILLAVEEGDPIAFINFQIDSENSNWNERPGWGMIREIHVNPGFRRHGVGSVLVRIATRVMRGSGATHAYLTTEDTFEFWEKLGWKRTDSIAPNGGTIMEKDLTEDEDATQ
ncbi:GNAT family N-acetyltransferase [Actinomyces minihominis]|uniref:GNAT family N-acetyltransferase n=1 Tax=Actinomyces minihominis TaxID=2002838 RepID=UPI000C08C189|nr:GNAT family N-acetyltransferase [Actinomyces minihominis]